jgi:hypothetical protein
MEGIPDGGFGVRSDRLAEHHGKLVVGEIPSCSSRFITDPESVTARGRMPAQLARRIENRDVAGQDQGVCDGFAGRR